MNELETKKAITNALRDFGTRSIADAALALLKSLGYQSQSRVELRSNAPESFLNQFDQVGRLNRDQAQLSEWQTVDFLFQLTGEEIQASAKNLSPFESDKRVNNQLIQSYLFFAIRLKGSHYNRSDLAAITRAVNRVFPMPALPALPKQKNACSGLWQPQ